MSLSADELRRYARHLVLPQVGATGQERLKQSRVLVIGAGGLGSPVALYLAAAGVGRIGLVDDDRVDVSNLQRQVLYGTAVLGQLKVDAAQQRLRDLNPTITIDAIPARFTRDNALTLVREYDIVVDGTDAFATRYLINDACVIAGRPNVHGSVHRYEGPGSLFGTAGGPCYRCLFPDPPEAGSVPSCADGGVLGVLPGIIGSLQAAEAIKLVVMTGTPLIGRLLHFDARSMRMHEIAIARDPACPSCGDGAARTLLDDYDLFCGTTASDPAVMNSEPVELTPTQLKQRMGEGWKPWLLDVREPWEYATANIAGAVLIPLEDLSQRAREVPKDQDVVVYCHHGMRSARAASMLRLAGWPHVFNLAGGIDRWATEADSSVPRY